MSGSPDNLVARKQVPSFAGKAADQDIMLAWLAYACLVASVIFQLTVVPETLGIKPLGRIINASLLLTFGVLAIMQALQVRVAIRVMHFYVIPLLLMLLGYCINLIGSISLDSIGYASILVPLLAAISIPFLRKFEIARAWQIYYRLLLVLCIISLVEYALVFLHWLPLSVHVNERNYFLRGILTVFYDLGASEPHYRLYGVFFEPGTATMLVLPALVFSLVHRRLLAIPVFLAVFALTNSLGGHIALAVTVAAFLYVRLDRFPHAGVWRFFVWTIILPIAVVTAFIVLAPAYEHKGASAAVRENNILGFFTGFLGIVLERPFGFPLSGYSLTELSSQEGYLGSNFMFYVAYVQGGILAALGYFVLFGAAVVTTVRVILAPSGQSPVALCAFISLPGMLLFSLQRGSLFETVLLGYLYAIPIIGVLAGSGVSAPPAGWGRQLKGAA